MAYSDILEQEVTNRQLMKAVEIIEKGGNPLDTSLDDLLIECETQPDDPLNASGSGESAPPESMENASTLVESRMTHGIHSEPKAFSFDAKGNVVPLFPTGVSTPLASAVKLPIDAWNKHRDAVARLSDEVLTQRVQDLSLQPASNGIGLAPYPDIREEFCATNIELNFRKKFAPRLREMRRSVEGEEDLLRDRICIDLHWLHCRNERQHIELPESVDPAFATLLTRPEFDFEAAWRFAHLNKKMPTRAAWLNLDDDLAWQLATIESEEMKKRFYTIMHGERREGHEVQVGYHRVLAILKSTVSKRLQPNIRAWATIWMCNRMIRTSGEKTSKTKLALFHAVITGRATPLDKNDIGSRLDSCEKYLRSYSRRE